MRAPCCTGLFRGFTSFTLCGGRWKVEGREREKGRTGNKGVSKRERGFEGGWERRREVQGGGGCRMWKEKKNEICIKGEKQRVKGSD